MNAYRIEVTYDSGMEVIDLFAVSSSEAIIDAIRLVDDKQLRYGVYKKVLGIRITK